MFNMLLDNEEKKSIYYQSKSLPENREGSGRHSFRVDRYFYFYLRYGSHNIRFRIQTVMIYNIQIDMNMIRYEIHEPSLEESYPSSRACTAHLSLSTQ